MDTIYEALRMKPKSTSKKRKSKSLVKLVKGKGTTKQEVVVGLDVKFQPPARKAHFQWSKSASRLSLQATGQSNSTSNEALFIDCMIACVTGIEDFRQRCPSEFDCEFMVLEGRNLSRDFTVGFSLAAFRAVAAATGFWPERYPDTLRAYGWRECN
jgi:hypothetical protein